MLPNIVDLFCYYKNMEIEEFIKKTLEQIDSAVTNSKGSDTTEYIVGDNGIEFDLAIVTAKLSKDNHNSKGVIGIRVVGLEGASNLSEKNSIENSSRIKFKVYLRDKSRAGRVISSRPVSF